VLLLLGTFFPGSGEPGSPSNAGALPGLPAGHSETHQLSGTANAEAGVQRDKLLRRLGIDAWHLAGAAGQGIKVAVLDSGFHDYTEYLGKALPAHVRAKSFRHDGSVDGHGSQHGILCGEVIHAIAPDAELMLVNWEPDQPASFLEAVQWTLDQGVKVISCSLIMPSWSDGEGGGAVNDALAKILGNGGAGQGALFFASAGNLAQRHWCGQLQRDSAGFHQWTAGHRNNVLTPWGEERVSVELYGAGCRDLELQVYDVVSAREVGHSRCAAEGSPSGKPCAVVRFEPRAESQYIVRVRGDKAFKSGSAPSFHLVVLGGAIQYATAAGSIAFPADGSAVLAVGAVDTDGRRVSYSSCGPNSRLPKPDYVAEVPFPSLWRDRPFAGTSAAAPQAAAMAALVWARHPDWTGQQVNKALQQASRDLGPMGHDWETGHGLLRLPE
jgi:subtilisin family serine protease